MSEMPPGLPKHPVGTFAFVGAYAVIFILLWFVFLLGWLVVLILGTWPLFRPNSNPRPLESSKRRSAGADE